MWRRSERFQEKIIISGVPSQICVSSYCGEFDVGLVSGNHEDEELLDYRGESYCKSASEVMNVVRNHIKSSWCFVSLVTYKDKSRGIYDMRKSQLIYSETFYSIHDPKILYLLDSLGNSSKVVRHWHFVMLFYCLFYKKVNVFF